MPVPLMHINLFLNKNRDVTCKRKTETKKQKSKSVPETPANTLETNEIEPSALLINTRLSIRTANDKSSI